MFGASHDKLKEYMLPQGWKISFPKAWKHEYDAESDHNVFYPKNDDLTFRITAMHIEMKGLSASVEIIRNAFLASTRDLYQKENFDFKHEDFAIDCMEGTTIENGNTIHRVSCGIAIEGFLLTVNVFASKQQSIEQSLFYINTICRV